MESREERATGRQALARSDRRAKGGSHCSRVPLVVTRSSRALEGKSGQAYRSRMSESKATEGDAAPIKGAEGTEGSPPETAGTTSTTQAAAPAAAANAAP